MKTLVINFKTYPEASGKNALKLAASALSKQKGVLAIVCPPQLDLLQVARVSSATVFGQHADEKESGKSTGSVTLEALKAAGAKGVLLNHSEKKVSVESAKAVCEKARALGLKVVACADSVEEAAMLAGFSPWAVAVEPPELIGSGRSVSTEDPDIVTAAVREIKSRDKSVLVFVGAGVSTPADCRKCVELGADGVLLASAFVFAKDKKRFVKQCLKAMGAG